MLGRVYLDLIAVAEHLSRERVEQHDALDLVAPVLDPHADRLVGRKDLQRIATDPEPAPGEVEVVALVLHVDELADEPVAAAGLALAHVGDEALVLLRGAEAEDA